MCTIGKKIKSMRIKKGLTQSQLGEAIGMTRYAIAKYEQGQRDPSLKVLIDIWNVLSLETLDEDYLLNEFNYNQELNKSKLEKWMQTNSKEDAIDLLIKYCNDIYIREGVDIRDNLDLDKIYKQLREVILSAIDLKLNSIK